MSPTLSHRVLQSYTTPHSENADPGGEFPFTSDGVQADVPSFLTDIISKSRGGTSHVVSPAIADDDRVFQEDLSSTPYGQNRRMVRLHVDLNNSTRHVRPILFNTVPKRGDRETESWELASSNREMIEKIVNPYQDELINIFFEKINISFPVFDESLFRRIYDTHKDTISPSLLCTLYGNTIVYWSTSSRLKNVPCPDLRTIWTQAESALAMESIGTPGISTIIATLLGLSGRPSSHTLGNCVQLGRVVALANALGSNRDPSNWNLSPSEKKFRIRIWWLLLVYDRWCGLAYGTPPLIHHAQHDVPVPLVEDLYGPGASNDQIFAASCFVALATLTEVLGRCLEHIYHLEKELSRKQEVFPFDLEKLLTDWEDSLDDNLRRLVIRGTRLVGPGAANLRLAYLSLKLLIRRCQLDWDRVSLQIGDVDSQHYVQARRVSEEIVDFVRELDTSHFGDFWIPFNAYSLTSATTFLLRSALNSRGLVRNSPLKLARYMIDTLRSHRRNYEWDIADNCLSNCSELVEKIEAVCQEPNLDGQELQASMPVNLDFDLDLDIAALNGVFPGFSGTSG